MAETTQINYITDWQYFINKINNFIENSDNYYTEINNSDNNEDNTAYFNDNYWNESIVDLKKAIEDLASQLNNFSEDTNGDAGYSYSNEPYVDPNTNADEKTYLNVRGEDALKSVLENSLNLQHTIEKNSDKIRLIMPKYKRRVEIEDLNRNFWVIGQCLNKIIDWADNLDTGLNPTLGGILNELIGLWQNIFRIWQVLATFENKIQNNEDSVNEIGSSAAKTKVQLAFSGGFGAQNPYENLPDLTRLYKNIKKVEENGQVYYTKIDGSFIDKNTVLELTETFTFTPNDVKYFGILPLIQSSNISDQTTNINGKVFYMPYNSTLSDNKILYKKDGMYQDENINRRFIINYTGIDNKTYGPSVYGEIIGIDRKFGTRPAREILEDVRARNFVLVAPYKNEEIPEVLKSFKAYIAPIEYTLQFFKEYLYYITKNSMAQIINEAMRTEYLAVLNFREELNLQLTTSIEVQTIKYCLNMLSETDDFLEIKDAPLFQGFFNSNSESITVQAFMNSMGMSSQADLLIQNFYLLYKTLAKFILNKIVPNDYDYAIALLKPPYFSENASSLITNEFFDIAGITLEADDNGNFDPFNTYFNERVSLYNDQYSSSSSVYSTINTAALFAGCQDYITNAKIGIKNGTTTKVYCKIDNKTSILPNRSEIQWDLLSVCLFKESFGIDENENNISEKKIERSYYPTAINASYLDNNGYKLNAVGEELLSNRMEEEAISTGWYPRGSANVCGNSYLYPRRNSFGLWYEFTSDPSFGIAQPLIGKIRSFTFNELSSITASAPDESGLSANTGINWAAQHYYNIDIAIPIFIKNLSEDIQYEDIIRVGKPYPSLLKLIEDRNYISLNTQENYLKIMQEMTNIGEKISNQYIDGFFGFDNFVDYGLDINPMYSSSDIDFMEVENVNTAIYMPMKYIKKFNRDHSNAAMLNPYYFGTTFYDHLRYEISSNDLVKENINNTEISTSLENNVVSVSEPLITLSYLNGSTGPQQIEISISKYTTPNLSQ